MRIGFVKPDYRIVGGAELVLSKIEPALEKLGHQVERVHVEVPAQISKAFGVELSHDIYEEAHQYFRFMAMAERFQALDLSQFDLVVSTQPPSYAIRHPRQLSVFYHHHRVYYDLSEIYLRARYTYRDIHETAQWALRRYDQPVLESVPWFLPISEVVQSRLERFNDITNSNVIHFTTDLAEEMMGEPSGDGRRHALCVTRHEFPKRAELFVHAMKYLPKVPGVMVGTGGRLEWSKTIDLTLSQRRVDLDAYDAEDLWLNQGASPWITGTDKKGRPLEHRSSNIEFVDFVDEARLKSLYKDALCVVAPAYLEDYGLTPIEAMAAGKPVVVCSDGGGLTDIVEHGVTGFVVDPTGREIAGAIETLHADLDLARWMGENARAAATGYTWQRTMDEFMQGFDRVAG